jgi:hypothetical protein
MEEVFLPGSTKLTARLTDHLGHDISSVQLYIGLTGLLYYVCTTVVTVVGTTFLIETAAHLTALAHLCFTGSALVITLFIIIGATFLFFIETNGLLTTTTHSCFNESVRLYFLLFTGFRNYVFNWDDSGPPSVDYWGVHTLVVDVRRLSDSLVGYT